MVGDRLDNNIFSAKAIGMKTIWIKQGFVLQIAKVEWEHILFTKY